MKFTNHIIVITSNYDCYTLYGKDTEPNKTVEAICERNKKYMEQKTGDLTVVVLHFRAGVQYDSK